MKSWIVNVILLLALGTSTYLFARKFAVPGKQDMLIASLSGIHKHLPIGATIKIINTVPEPLSERHKEVFPHFLGYILPPTKISKDTINEGDTLLVLLYADAPPGIRDSLVNDKTIIWQNKDSLYQYILIH